MSNVEYKKVLNRRDPFDRLILELGTNGTLDVSAIGLKKGEQNQSMKRYSRKTLTPRGKHSM